MSVALCLHDCLFQVSVVRIAAEVEPDSTHRRPRPHHLIAQLRCFCVPLCYFSTHTFSLFVVVLVFPVVGSRTGGEDYDAEFLFSLSLSPV